MQKTLKKFVSIQIKENISMCLQHKVLVQHFVLLATRSVAPTQKKFISYFCASTPVMHSVLATQESKARRFCETRTYTSRATLTFFNPKLYNHSKLRNYMMEIRVRSGYIFISSICTFLIAYQKATQLTYMFLLSFSIEKGGKKNFIFTDVSEAFSSTIYICLSFSFFCIIPFVIYHFFCFISPSWYSYERKTQVKHMLVIFLGWVAYIYLIQTFIIAELCVFFLTFQVKSEYLIIRIEPKIIEYVSWATTLFAFATLLFVFFLFLYFFFVFDKISVKKDWIKIRKSFLLFFLFFSSVVTPPDIWSQLFLSCFLSVFFELLIWIFFVYAFLHKCYNHIQKE